MIYKANDLLEDFSIGDYVRICYGDKNNTSFVEGTIRSWNQRFLSLNKSNKKVFKILIEDIRILDQIEQSAAVEDDRKHEKSDSPSEQTKIFKSLDKTEYRNLRQMAVLMPYQPYTFKAEETLESIKSSLDSIESDKFKYEMNCLFSSLMSFWKTGSINDKYHDLRERLLNSWDMCETAADYDFFYFLLGILAILAENYPAALEPLVRCKKMLPASYAAEKAGNMELFQIFSLCALFSGEISDINQFVSDMLIAHRDVETLRKLLELHQEDNDWCEKIASCAYMMFKACKGVLKEDITPFFSARNTAEKLLEAVPKTWKNSRSAFSYWQEYQSYSYPVSSVSTSTSDVQLVGYINKFNREQKWGFITPNHYFYIRQVRDDTEEGIMLRKLLFSGIWENLEVKFRLGVSTIKPDKTAAYTIELTKAGYETAMQRLAKEKISPVRTGVVMDFDRASAEAQIMAEDGNLYHFDIEDIRDPYLKSYYRESTSFNKQRVIFEISEESAVNVCWLEPDENDRKAYAYAVTQEEKEEWKAFLNRNSRRPVAVFPETDPYQYFGYQSLSSSKAESVQTKSSPLSWNKNVISSKKMSVKEYAKKARKAIKRGDVETAGSCLENALEQYGFNESIVCDYISLHMRPGGDIDRAIRLIDLYEEQILPQKLLNLRIQVYDKKKEYNTLCPLYEAAFRQATDLSKKSHILLRLIESYFKCKQYSDAVDACLRWESLYIQNQFNPNAEKMKKFSSHVKQQKAVCLYYLGNMEEARKIAADLIRSNPTDAAATHILEGTLEDASLSVMLDENNNDMMDFNEWDDVSEANNSVITRFVRELISTEDIADSLGSQENIKDKKYIGTKEQGISDVDRLLNKKYINVKKRSSGFLSACKILEHLEQKYDEPSFRRRKCQIAGKAMVAWGDHMVSDCNKLDTVRMAYLFALKVLDTSRKSLEYDWNDAYNRYLRSYFMAQKGKDSLEEYIAYQNEQNLHQKADTDILVDNKLNKFLLKEFVVGMLMLIDVLKDKKNRRDTLIEDIYSKNSELKEGFCSQLKVYDSEYVFSHPTAKKFKEMINLAVNKLSEKHQELSKIISGISRTLLLEPLPAFCEALDNDVWENFLTNTDLTRLGQISNIVKRSQDYFNSSNFESRLECLRDILSKTDNLINSIDREPTDISYDVYLPALEQIKSNVTDMQRRIYLDSMPSLSWAETTQPFKRADGKIQIQLLVKNKRGCQSADFLSIVNVTGTEVCAWEKPDIIRTLRGGENIEVILSVSLSDTASENNVFSAEIEWEYSCSDNSQTIIKKHQKDNREFIIFNGDFENLKDPFEAYIQLPMEREDLFVGRSKLIENITGTVVRENGKNYGRAFALYGQTRTGKSSVLHHLAKRLKTEYGNDAVIWDMKNISGCKIENISYFIFGLLNAGNDAFRKNKELYNDMKQNDLLPETDKILKNPDNAVLYFREYMGKVDSFMRQHNKIIVLLIDEFTDLHGRIKDGSLPEDFMRFWKALLENYCIFAVIAGQDDMPEFYREYPNEFNCMELRKLTYLEEQDAKFLIRKIEEENGKKMFKTNDSVDELYRITAGSAYLIVILCSYLIKYLNEKGTYIVTKGIISDFLKTKAFGPNGFLTELNFESQLQERGHRELDKINEEVLTAIARLSVDDEDTSLSNILSNIHCKDFSDEEVKECVHRLVDRNVLTRLNGTQQYSIQVKLFERWLIENRGE